MATLPLPFPPVEFQVGIGVGVQRLQRAGVVAKRFAERANRFELVERLGLEEESAVEMRSRRGYGGRNRLRGRGSVGHGPGDREVLRACCGTAAEKRESNGPS
jgi:hypothetical protein